MAIKTFYQNKKIFLFGAIPILSLFLYSDSASAQATYNALVTIPGIPNGAGVTVYLSGLYTFLISVVGIVAMGAIVLGGARYLTSAGNPSAVEDAKHTINSAIYGLILALASWIIINEINPDILVLKNPAMPWSATGYSSTTSAPNCALPGGDGTAAAPCTCIDGAQVVSNIAGSTATILTLTVAPSSIGDGLPTDIHMTGKLTDASGNSISGAQIEVNKMATALNASSTFIGNTNATGDYDIFFTVNATGDSCASNDNMQAVFAGGTIGATAYSAIGSNVVVFTKLSATPVCTINDYGTYFPGGPQPVATLWTADTSDICDQTCSDASKQASAIAPALIGYHCLGAKITVSGNNLTLNPDGVSANMKVNGDVTIDGITASVFPDATTKIQSTYDWTIGAFSKIDDPVGILYPSDTAGVFAAAGNYVINLIINTPPTAPGAPQDVTAKFTLIVTN